jgi:hypothetical protein
MAPMQSNSGLAACMVWGGNARLYYQDTSGSIIEASMDGTGKWTAGGSIGVQAKLGSPLAAVAWGSNPQV